jgi:hypothetical protein
MRLSVRSLLIWLLVLAMPVQAIAAAGMQHCGPVHQLMQAGSTAAVWTDGQDMPHDATVPHDATPHEHTGAATKADAEPSPSSSSDATLNAAGFADDYTCSACANCCSAVALPSAVVQIPALPIGTHVSMLPVSEVISFVPGGIDRPPRTILA